MEQSLFLGRKSPAQEPSGCELARRSRARQPCFLWPRCRRTLTRVHPPHVAVLLCASLCRARRRGTFHPASSERAFKVDRAERSKEPVLPGPAGGRPACPLPPTAETLHSPVLRLRSPARSLPVHLTPVYASRRALEPGRRALEPGPHALEPSRRALEPSRRALEPYFSRYYTVRLELSFFLCFFNVLFLKNYY